MEEKNNRTIVIQEMKEEWKKKMIETRLPGERQWFISLPLSLFLSSSKFVSKLNSRCCVIRESMKKLLKIHIRYELKRDWEKIRNICHAKKKVKKAWDHHSSSKDEEWQTRFQSKSLRFLEKRSRWSLSLFKSSNTQITCSGSNVNDPSHSLSSEDSVDKYFFTSVKRGRDEKRDFQLKASHLVSCLHLNEKAEEEGKGYRLTHYYSSESFKLTLTTQWLEWLAKRSAN